MKLKKNIMNEYTDEWQTKWAYNCGWSIKGDHPYRLIFFGDQLLNQPIGILEFYKEYGILPSTKTI